jgi:chromosome partitioning protein
MITIAVANQKGGVGKTTISFNLAYILAAKRGIRVLAVDNDAQAHLTGSFMNDRTNPKTFITNAYKGEPLTPQKINKNIHLIGANESLAHLTDGDIDILYRLRDSLRKFNTCDSKYKFDYAIIDCLPSSSFVQMAALAAADFVLIPVKPANYDFKGMASFMVQIEKIRHRLNPNLKILGMVINQVDGRRPRMERDM